MYIYILSFILKIILEYFFALNTFIYIFSYIHMLYIFFFILFIFIFIIFIFIYLFYLFLSLFFYSFTFLNIFSLNFLYFYIFFFLYVYLIFFHSSIYFHYIINSLSVIHTPAAMTGTGGAETSDVRRGEWQARPIRGRGCAARGRSFRQKANNHANRGI